MTDIDSKNSSRTDCSSSSMANEKKVNINELNPGEASVCLGFLEDTDAWRLSSKFFPSKVGGYPSWLSLEGLPTGEQLSCHSCQQPLSFLCQLYLPDSTRDHAFHRTLFLFVCRKGTCSRANTPNGLRVFRSQLARKNKYYDYEPPVEEQATAHVPSAAQYCKLCAVCGAAGRQVCSQCRRVNYCSKEHQRLHRGDGHKLDCRTPDNRTSTAVKNTFLFPEAEIILEPLGDDEEEDEEGDESELSMEEIQEQIKTVLEHDPRVEIDETSFLRSPEQLREEREKDKNSKWKKKKTSPVSDPDGVTELEGLAHTEKDAIFAAFQEKMDDDPEQVVRYHRGGLPLFCSNRKKPIPAGNAYRSCPHCKQQRTFEFQIMPQMLNHLNVDDTGASLDWGVLLVYTCYCDSPLPYNEEIIYRQDFSD